MEKKLGEGYIVGMIENNKKAIEKKLEDAVRVTNKLKEDTSNQKRRTGDCELFAREVRNLKRNAKARLDKLKDQRDDLSKEKEKFTRLDEEAKSIVKKEKEKLEKAARDAKLLNDKICNQKRRGYFFCSECQSVFPYEGKLRDHQKTCIKQEYKCRFCGAMSYNKSYYRSVHRKMCNRGEPLPDTDYLVVDPGKNAEIRKFQMCRVVYNRIKGLVC